MPTAGDGFVDLGGPKVADNAPNGDLSNDSLELLLEQDMASHDAMMQEHRGNVESAHSIVRHSGARKFNQEDPMEAAAAEMILQKNV
jgi:hypothetical protein